MKRFFSFALAALLALAPASAQSPQVRALLLGPRPAAGSALPGPPTFTFQGANSASNGVTVTYTSVPIGTASATRFVAIVVVQVQTGGTQALSATINGSSTGVTLTPLGANGEGALELVTANVTTGTTLTLALTYSGGGPAGSNRISTYTSDTTTLSSTTPIVSSLAQVTSVTSQTSTINIASNGSAVLVGFFGFGITNGTQAFTTPNDSSVTLDDSFSSLMSGHANGASANATSRVSANWTTAGDGNMAIVGFR